MAGPNSMNAANARRAYPEEAWEAMQPLIRKYYIDDGLSLAATMKVMRQNHDFSATEKMYKTRFRKWEGFDKYIKDHTAFEVLTGNGLARAKTTTTRPVIAGREITEEEARRHLKRKKVNTWSTPQQAVQNDMMMDMDVLSSPDTEQHMPFYNGAMMPLTPGFLMDDAIIQQNGYVTQPVDEVVDEDIEMDDAPMAQNDPLAMATEQFWDDPNTTMVVSRQRSPSLLLTRGLSFTTESFLHSMSEFADISLRSFSSGFVQSEADKRFNKLWDLFCTKATHMQNNRNDQALIVRNDAQVTFSKMLNTGDPWLLLSLCLVINDNLSNPARIAASTSFLGDLAQWASSSAGDHPIARLVSYLLQTNDSGLMLLEGTIRMVTEKLNAQLGIQHELSLELSRLHSRIMTEINMHTTADKLLSEDLAEIEQLCGSNSLQNLLRKSSLARCRYMAKDFFGSLQLYRQILAAPLLQKEFLADIKYGAMYFVAKSNAQLGRYDVAISEAQAALQFSLEKQGNDHYWANNAREMIREFEVARARKFEVIE
ncbi:hypothetical protein PMZ80_010451 [Knufia obscura]|uniref:Clr5 domain-containing protein n=2 Tax=Knufia TaxID=430999 RepID=A0AAN8E7N1_9EURO|nr:hypothetical protein PMZ80_010451 [Knufia obscura]KAK5948014.1 hypothetical protein OHC33_010942 [Knufia fluminis]